MDIMTTIVNDILAHSCPSERRDDGSELHYIDTHCYRLAVIAFPPRNATDGWKVIDKWGWTHE